MHNFTAFRFSKRTSLMEQTTIGTLCYLDRLEPQHHNLPGLDPRRKTAQVEEHVG